MADYVIKAGTLGAEETLELMSSLERSGMRRTICACGQEFLTRGDSNHCPPCRDRARCLELAPVLERMVELLGATDGPITFAQALAQAAAEQGTHIEPGTEDEELLIRAAFKVMSQRGIPGAAEA